MKNALIILALALLAFACGEPVQPEPVETPGPALVSISPPDGTGGIEGSSLSVVFTFDQNILCTAQALSAISAADEASSSANTLPRIRDARASSPAPRAIANSGV